MNRLDHSEAWNRRAEQPKPPMAAPGAVDKEKLLNDIIDFIEKECIPACVPGYETAGSDESRGLDEECKEWDKKVEQFKQRFNCVSAVPADQTKEEKL